MNAVFLRLSSAGFRCLEGCVTGVRLGGGSVSVEAMLVVVMLALIAGVPSLHAADSAGAPRVSAGETRVRETGVLPQGGLLDRLPLGSELGDSWQRDLDLLIDPESSPGEYFPPDTKAETKAFLKKQIKVPAHCQMAYRRGASREFEAWITRHEKEEGASAQWKSLKDLESPPLLANGKGGRRSVMIGNVETLVFESSKGNSVFVRSGSNVLSLNLFSPTNGVPEEFFKTVAVFVRKLTKEKAAAEPQPKP